MAELKLCPFCGKQPLTRVRTVRYGSITSILEFSIKCECGIEKRLKLELCDTDFSEIISSINAVIENWNSRTSKEMGGDKYISSMSKVVKEIINLRNEEIERLKSELIARDKIIDERGSEVIRHDNAIRSLHEQLKTAKSEAIKEFWNNRPERLNEQAEGKEEYNKGWNACLDEFCRIRELIEEGKVSL